MKQQGAPLGSYQRFQGAYRVGYRCLYGPSLCGSGDLAEEDRPIDR